LLLGIKQESEAVTTDQGQQLADKLGIQSVETSLDDREKIEEIFYSLTKGIWDRKSSEV